MRISSGALTLLRQVLIFRPDLFAPEAVWTMSQVFFLLLLLFLFKRDLNSEGDFDSEAAHLTCMAMK